MDTDKIKNFFVYNVEKIILAVVIGVSVFLIYSGYQQPLFTAKNDPEDLKTEANKVKLAIDLDHNDAVIVHNRKEPEDGESCGRDLVTKIIRTVLRKHLGII